jgi:hypothetical protein
VAAVLIIIFACAWLALAGETLPPAATVMDAYVEATGGLDAYDRIHNRISEGVLEIVGQGVSLSMTISNARGARLHVVAESDLTGTLESGVCDGVVWERNLVTGPRIKDGIEREIAIRDAALDKYARWRSVFSQVETVAVEQVERASCYRIQAEPTVGKAMTLFYDRDSGLLLRVDTVVETAMGEIPVEARFEDYRAIDGVLLPHRLRTTLMGQERLFTATKVRHNVDLAEDAFVPPTEVLELVENLDDSPAS